MIKRRGLFLLVLILSLVFISFVSAEGSSDISYFTVAGCDNNMPAGTCSADGTQYCSADGTIWDTLSSNICTLIGSCCPSGYYCDITIALTCVKRTVTCNDILVKSTCEDNGCIWDSNSVGVPNCRDPSEFESCSDYLSSEACDKDDANMGPHGIGSEICSAGTYIQDLGLVVKYDSCRCEWDNLGDGDECVLAHDVTNQTNPGEGDLYLCQRSFILGECIDEIQKLTWTGTITPDPGNTLTPADKIALGCASSSKDINCGGPIVKLPFFGFFNFITVFILLTVFYFKKDILNFFKRG